MEECVGTRLKNPIKLTEVPETYTRVWFFGVCTKPVDYKGTTLPQRIIQSSISIYLYPRVVVLCCAVLCCVAAVIWLFLAFHPVYIYIRTYIFLRPEVNSTFTDERSKKNVIPYIEKERERERERIECFSVESVVWWTGWKANNCPT